MRTSIHVHTKSLIFAKMKLSSFARRFIANGVSHKLLSPQSLKPTLFSTETSSRLNGTLSDKMSPAHLSRRLAFMDADFGIFLDYGAKLTVPQSASLTAPEVALQPVTQGDASGVDTVNSCFATSIATPIRNCYILKFFGSFFQERTPLRRAVPRKKPPRRAAPEAPVAPVSSRKPPCLSACVYFTPQGSVCQGILSEKCCLLHEKLLEEKGCAWYTLTKKAAESRNENGGNKHEPVQKIQSRRDRLRHDK